MTEAQPQAQPQAQTRRARALVVASVSLALVVAAFWVCRVLLSGKSVDLLTSDLFLYYLPAYETLYGQLLAGTLPLWNPYQLGGLPGLASLQAGFFYPGHILYLLMPTWSAFAISSIAHLVLLGVGAMVLVRRLGLVLPAAIAAALVLVVRGRYPQMVVFPNMIEAAVWLPVGALAVLSIVRGGGFRAAAFLALSLGMSLLAGYPQLSVYLVYCWGGLLVIFLLRERADAPRWLRATLLVGLGILLGGALASVQLFPAFELTAQGTRSPGPLTRWEQFPFGWYGPGLGRALADTVRAPFPELPLSLGAVALVLLPLALLHRGHRALGIGSCIVAGVVVLFAMGPVTPLFDWLVSLPALGWFRFPRRALFMADFFIALALAVAWDLAARFAGRDVGAARAPFVLGTCGAAALAVVLLASQPESFVPALRFAPGVLAVAALGVLGMAVVAPHRLVHAPLVLVALLVAELVLAEANRPFDWSGPISLDAYHPRERGQEQADAFRKLAASPDRVWLRSLGIQPALPPKLATYAELRSVGDYEPLNLRRQAEYFTYLMEGQLLPARQGRPYSGRLKHLTAPTYPGALEARGHLLDVAGVRWFLVSRKAAARGELADYVEAQGFVAALLPAAGPMLLENPHAVPRAFAVYEVQPAPEPLVLLERMSDRAFDPLATSYAEGFALPRAAGAPPRGPAASIVVDDRTRVEIVVALEAPGMLVLADSFYPGWHATEAGRELPIHAVNHLFRGVPLPAGEHRVRFEYTPKALYAGAGSSLVALLSIGVLLRVRGRPVASAAAR